VSNREAIRAQLAASIGEASAGMAWLEKVRIKVTAPLDLPGWPSVTIRSAC
jgi:hypothetical protein